MPVRHGKVVVRLRVLGFCPDRCGKGFDRPGDIAFSKLYIAAKMGDIVIIKSPVGMPGRAIKTKLVEEVVRGRRELIKCNYRCLKTCNPSTTPYCIMHALYNAVLGNIDNAVVFAGTNVSKVEKIVSVKELMDDIVSDAIEELDKII